MDFIKETWWLLVLILGSILWVDRRARTEVYDDAEERELADARRDADGMRQLSWAERVRAALRRAKRND